MAQNMRGTRRPAILTPAQSGSGIGVKVTTTSIMRASNPGPVNGGVAAAASNSSAISKTPSTSIAATTVCRDRRHGVGGSSLVRQQGQDAAVTEAVNAMSTIKIGVRSRRPAPKSSLLKVASTTSAPTRQDANNNKKALMISPVAEKENPETIMSNESQQLLKNFDAGNCQFCYIDLKPGDGIMIQECLHLFCRDCLQSTIETQKEVVQIPCPISDERNCGGFLTDGEVKELVRLDVYQEYIDRSLVVAKKKMKNVFSCKTNKCGGWCEFEEGRKTFVCPICNQSNCMKCEAIHTGVDCETFKTLSQNGQYSKVTELMDKDRKNGWEQLTQIMKSSGDASGLSINDILIKIGQIDLLSNTMEFECPICLTDIAVGDGIILHECLHLFCRDCLSHHVEFNDEPTVKCPYIDGNYSCVCFMQPREIKTLVTKEIHEKHLQRSMKLGESSMGNSFHCKTPDCPGWCEYDVGATKFNCPYCNKMNCIACNALHNDSCEDYKNTLKQNVNDKLSLEAVEKLVKEGKAMRCPKCKIAVQKTIGCDWLQCSACKTEICWATRGPRWGPKGRGDTSAGCKCRVNGKLCHPKCGNCH